jgi:hypothetical protein
MRAVVADAPAMLPSRRPAITTDSGAKYDTRYWRNSGLPKESTKTVLAWVTGNSVFPRVRLLLPSQMKSGMLPIGNPIEA